MASLIEKPEFQIRPRFTLTSKASIESICARYKTILLTKQAPFQGKVRHGYISIVPSIEHQHYWSPHLSVTVEEDEDDPTITLLKGLYGPSPAVWTMFVFFYAIIAVATVIIAVIGFASMSIGESYSILWALPVLIILFLSLYLTSYFGQLKGHSQIEIIDEFFMNVYEDINKKNRVI